MHSIIKLLKSDLSYHYAEWYKSAMLYFWVFNTLSIVIYIIFYIYDLNGISLQRYIPGILILSTINLAVSHMLFISVLFFDSNYSKDITKLHIQIPVSSEELGAYRIIKPLVLLVSYFLYLGIVYLLCEYLPVSDGYGYYLKQDSFIRSNPLAVLAYIPLVFGFRLLIDGQKFNLPNMIASICIPLLCFFGVTLFLQLTGKPTDDNYLTRVYNIINKPYILLTISVALMIYARNIFMSRDSFVEKEP